MIDNESVQSDILLFEHSHINNLDYAFGCSVEAPSDTEYPFSTTTLTTFTTGVSYFTSFFTKSTLFIILVNILRWDFNTEDEKKEYQTHINKNVKPTHRSLHYSRRPGNCPYCRNEQIRTSRRYVYSYPITPKPPMV